ncbi:MAG: hypothetical protein LBH63_02465, partial [Clostridiales Family XIII bacterium]|nr:hypothetical protein [Clostridiales Family XIII bacterium]
MITTLNAYTEELDDVALAVSQIMNELDLDINRRKNSIAIVNCYSEFLDNGIVEALSDALPFDLIGTTTMFCGTQSDRGGLGLAIQVLTSDDVSFRACYSPPLSEDQETRIKQSYKAAASAYAEKPKMMLTYAPMLQTIGFDQLVNWLDEASDGVPNFGCLAVDHTVDFAKARSFFNGDYSWDRVGIVLMYGNLTPRFLMASVAEENIMPRAVTVTKSQENILMEVNEIPFASYLQQLGLAAGNEITARETLPLIIDVLDGAQPVSRVIL